MFVSTYIFFHLSFTIFFFIFIIYYFFIIALSHYFFSSFFLSLLLPFHHSFSFPSKRNSHRPFPSCHIIFPSHTIYLCFTPDHSSHQSSPVPSHPTISPLPSIFPFLIYFHASHHTFVIPYRPSSIIPSLLSSIITVHSIFIYFVSLPFSLFFCPPFMLYLPFSPSPYL